MDESNGTVTLGLGPWQQLIQLQSRLGGMIRKIANPSDED
jgi:hypothetical protein